MSRDLEKIEVFYHEKEMLLEFNRSPTVLRKELHIVGHNFTIVACPNGNLLVVHESLEEFHKPARDMLGCDLVIRGAVKVQVPAEILLQVEELIEAERQVDETKQKLHQWQIIKKMFDQ